jgi:hypothetical protein
MLKKITLISVVFLLLTNSAPGEELAQLVPAESYFVYNVNLSKILKIDPKFNEKVPNLLVFATKVANAANMNSSPIPANPVTEIQSAPLCFFTLAKAKDLPGTLFGLSLIILVRAFHIDDQFPEFSKMSDNNEFVRKTGIDPPRHINAITVFVWGNVRKVDQERAILFDGSFEVPKILESIRKDETVSRNVSIERLEGFDVVRAKEETDGMGVFLSNSTVAVGTNDAVKSVIAVRSNKAKNIFTNQLFCGLVKKIDTGASIWGAGIISQFHKEQLKSNHLLAPLAGIDALAFSFDYDTELNLDITALAETKNSMDAIMVELNKWLGILKGFAAGPNVPPELAELLAILKIESAGTEGKISLTVSKKKIDELREILKKRNSPGK